MSISALCKCYRTKAKLHESFQAKELVDQHAFERECIGDEEEPPKKLCLLAFLPNILDTKAAGRRDYIQVRAAMTLLTSCYLTFEGLKSYCNPEASLILFSRALIGLDLILLYPEVE